MSRFIPSAQELCSIADALREFLDAFEKCRPVLEDKWNAVEALILRSTIEQHLRRLVRAYNTRCSQPAELQQVTVAGWPVLTISALYRLKSNLETIVRRWDVPEVCGDCPIGHRGEGTFGRTQEDGTWVGETINRPARPYALTPDEIKKLTWVEGTLRAAIDDLAADTFRVRFDDPDCQAAWEKHQAGTPDILPKPEALIPPESIVDYAALVEELRRRGKGAPARLVEFMADKISASCEDVGREVHDDENANDQTVRMNARRTSDELAEMGSRVSFRVSTGRVFKNVSPE